MSSTVHIKNMVCNRCIMAVEAIFKELNIEITDVQLGTVALSNAIDTTTKEVLKKKLVAVGFELLNDPREQLVEQVKNRIISTIYDGDEMVYTFSQIISDELGMDYPQISKIFSEIEQTTIEKFFIKQKIERAKELLSYDEMTLTEIADALHYSSVSHLSAQFKKITGVTPSQYKLQGQKQRNTLDKL